MFRTSLTSVEIDAKVTVSKAMLTRLIQKANKIDACLFLVRINSIYVIISNV